MPGHVCRRQSETLDGVISEIAVVEKLERGDGDMPFPSLLSRRRCPSIEHDAMRTEDTSNQYSFSCLPKLGIGATNIILKLNGLGRARGADFLSRVDFEIQEVSIVIEGRIWNKSPFPDSSRLDQRESNFTRSITLPRPSVRKTRQLARR